MSSKKTGHGFRLRPKGQATRILEVLGLKSSRTMLVPAVNLGCSSRAERLRGTIDEIEKSTLKITQNFDKRQVDTGFPLTRESTNRWFSTINNLTISFDYTITGHTYKCTVFPEGASYSISFDNFTVSTLVGKGTSVSCDVQGTTATFKNSTNAEHNSGEPFLPEWLFKEVSKVIYKGIKWNRLKI